MRKTQPRKVSNFTHDHLASKWHGQDLNPGHLGPKFMHFITVLCSPPPEPRAPSPREKGQGLGRPRVFCSKARGLAPPGSPPLHSDPGAPGAGTSEEPRAWDSALRFKAHMHAKGSGLQRPHGAELGEGATK